MANRLPWFPLYVDDYLNDTYDLNPCEHGVYLLLLSRFWVSGPLRDNLDALCRIAAGAQPQTVREILERFWELTGQGWVNRRMMKEMEKSEAVSARATAANQIRWGKKSIKTTTACIQMDIPLESKRISKCCPNTEEMEDMQNTEKKTSIKTTIEGIQMESNPHPHPHPQEEEQEDGTRKPQKQRKHHLSSKKDVDIAPDGVDQQAWTDFVQHRRERRDPLTTLGATKNANILRKLTTEQQREAVDTTIRNGWRGLFPPKQNGANTLNVQKRKTEIFA